MRKDKSEKIAAAIESYLSECNFSTAGIPGTDPTLGAVIGPGEEYIIKLITRLAISGITAWWSAREILDYIQKRKLLKDYHYDPTDE